MRQIYKTISNQKPLSTIKKLTKIECAYISGMIDADGSICKCKNRDSFVCKVKVHNSSKVVMDWLKKTIGAGNIYYQPPSIEKNGYKHTLPRWTYDISAKIDVIELLKQIEPYLIIKKREAQNLILLIPTMKRPTKYKHKNG